MIGPSLVRSLHHKKYRDREGLFLVQGRKLVEELLASGWPVRGMMATEEAVAGLEVAGLPLQVLPAAELKRLGTLVTGNELVAVVERPDEAPGGAPVAGELVLALDGVSDPGNMGTLLRIADWFGVRRVVCGARCVEVWNPKCVQATMGSLFRVRVEQASLPGLLQEWSTAGTMVYLADMSGTPVHQVALRRPAVLVMGSESHGLSAEVSSVPGTRVSVPGRGGAESLNVAMAASALCMEFLRQTEAG